MLKLISAALIVAAAAAQTPTTPPTPPSPPACLSGPVTQGTVTLSCSAIDTTTGGPNDNPALMGSDYLFQVRISSADPNVIAVLVQITVSQGVNQPYQRSVAMAPTATGAYSYTFVLGPAVLTSTPTTATIGAPTVTAVQVQELKPSSTQSF